MRASHVAALAIAVGLVFLITLFFRGDESVQRAEAPRAIPRIPSSKVPAVELEQPGLRGASSTEQALESAADERRSPIAGPRGRVLEAGTDRPVEGLPVQVRAGRKVLAEALTGPEGSFSLPQPERPRCAVEVVSDDWRVAPRRLRLDEEQRRGASELLFRAERIVSAPLRGRLTDRSTGEPVPEFLLHARGPRGDARKWEAPGDPDAGKPTLAISFRSRPRRVESIVTGADGRFVSQGGFEDGLLDLVLADHPSFLERRTSSPDDGKAIEHEHSIDDLGRSKDAEIEVAIGPTYRLDVTLPSGTDVEDFYATFPRTSPGLRGMHRAVAGDPRSPMAFFFGGATKPNAGEQRAPLREGEPLWARFRDPVPRALPTSDDRRGHVLHLRSRDGYWSGSAPVTSIEGVSPEVVSVSLERRGSVEGTVLNGDGEPVPTAWIELIAASAPDSPTREVGADRKGRFAFRWLAEGDYELVVQTDRYEEARSTVSIVEGTTERAKVRLNSGVPLGTISGLLRSRTGQHRTKGGIVSLKSLDDPEFFLFKTVSYRARKGEFIAAFSFANVPSGSYELRLEPQDNRRWETRAMTVSPPVEGLEFICEDDAPTFDLALRAIDARTGNPIETSWSIVWQGDPLDDVRLDDDWESGLYRGVPEGVPLRWILRAQGHRLAAGDQTDIRAHADHRVIEARLEPGWGQVFTVTTRDDEPIAGVELLADGSSIGVTDALGVVAINLDAKPNRLEFQYRDWVVASGSVDPNEASFGWGPETRVVLGPRR